MCAADFYVCGVCGGVYSGVADIRGDIYVFGGGANRFSFYAVLCVGVLYFCGGDAATLGVFAVFDADGAGGSDGAGTVSGDGVKDRERPDGGAKDEVYCANNLYVAGVGSGVGGGDVAADDDRLVAEGANRLAERRTVCAGAAADDDFVYIYLCSGVFIFILQEGTSI